MALGVLVDRRSLVKWGVWLLFSPRKKLAKRKIKKNPKCVKSPNAKAKKKKRKTENERRLRGGFHVD